MTTSPSDLPTPSEAVSERQFQAEAEWLLLMAVPLASPCSDFNDWQEWHDRREALLVKSGAIRLSDHMSEQPAATRTSPQPSEQAIQRMRDALGYISSPTMGLPGGADAREFCMDGATEGAARYALQCCIDTARAALEAALGVAG